MRYLLAMKNKVLFFLAIFLIIASCKTSLDVEKRKYKKGYNFHISDHLTFLKSKTKDKKEESKIIAPIQLQASPDTMKPVKYPELPGTESREENSNISKPSERDFNQLPITTRTEIFSSVSFFTGVLIIIGTIVTGTYFFLLLAGITILFGIIGLIRIYRHPDIFRGKKLAKKGIVIGILALILLAFWLSRIIIF